MEGNSESEKRTGARRINKGYFILGGGFKIPRHLPPSPGLVPTSEAAAGSTCGFWRSLLCYARFILTRDRLRARESPDGTSLPILVTKNTITEKKHDHSQMEPTRSIRMILQSLQANIQPYAYHPNIARCTATPQRREPSSSRGTTCHFREHCGKLRCRLYYLSRRQQVR